VQAVPEPVNVLLCTVKFELEAVPVGEGELPQLMLQLTRSTY
jgi:hypothetical protein